MINKFINLRKKDIGQHFLINEAVMQEIVDLTPQNKTIIEIGAGSGLLTKHLVKTSRKVYAIEIDKSFSRSLSLLEKKTKNLVVLYQNALKLLNKNNFKKNFGKESNLWISGNIPYHITEPLIMRIVTLPVHGATLLTGARFANEITATQDSKDFGKLGILVNTFFKPKLKGYVEKQNFFPPPRTTSAIITLETKTKNDILNDQTAYLFKEIFLSSHRGTLIKNILRESIIRYKQYLLTGSNNKTRRFLITKNEAREIIKELHLPNEILDKSVEQLTNDEFKILFRELQKLHIQ
jgi:16S rRNA (adenine1518-N6/adenine1519-N6)-dimethyltransferase